MRAGVPLTSPLRVDGIALLSPALISLATALPFQSSLSFPNSVIPLVFFFRSSDAFDFFVI